MYVLVVYNYWEDDLVDCVLGPFATLQEAQQARKKEFGERYRKTSVQKVIDTVPEWSKSPE